jgi:hypothetical protein
MTWRTASAALAIAALTAAAPAAGQSPGAPDSARMVSVRMYQNDRLTAEHESPASIGADLASLRPSFVSALLRYDKLERVTPRQARDWNIVVSAVQEASPEAQFDVELNGLQYKKAGQITRVMSKIRTAIAPDGWLIDFYTPAARLRPKVMAAAVSSAHANGEFLGGNAFGITKHPVIPSGTDYVAVQDADFKVNLAATRQLAQRVTTFMHLGNDPDDAQSDGCRFIEEFNTSQRIAYVRKRAGQQAANNFRFEYPVFFPECARNRGRQTPTVFTYNATKDKPMMPTIGSLLDKYEPQASLFSFLP